MNLFKGLSMEGGTKIRAGFFFFILNINISLFVFKFSTKGLSSCIISSLLSPQELASRTKTRQQRVCLAFAVEVIGGVFA